jgi:hypothetical protein
VTHQVKALRAVEAQAQPAVTHQAMWAPMVVQDYNLVYPEQLHIMPVAVAVANIIISMVLEVAAQAVVVTETILIPAEVRVLQTLVVEVEVAHIVGFHSCQVVPVDPGS